MAMVESVTFVTFVAIADPCEGDAYDIYGRPRSVEVAGQGKTEYEYSSDHRTRTIIRTVAQGGARLITKEITDGFGRLVRRENPDGTAMEFFFDEYGRSTGSRLIASNGKQQTATETLYDVLDRPVSITNAGGAKETFEYAVDGDLTVVIRKQSITGNGNVQNVESKEYRNAFDQVVKTVSPDGGMTEMTYDGFGNLKSSRLTPAGGGEVQVRSFVYDSLGRLSSVAGSGTHQHYTYDANGMRVALKDSVAPGNNRRYFYAAGGLLIGEYGISKRNAGSREVIYLGNEPIAEVDEKGIHDHPTKAKRQEGRTKSAKPIVARRARSAATSPLHKDHLGTPRLITSGIIGKIEGRQAYGAYGEFLPDASPDNTYKPLIGYTGHIQTDATGLIYMRGRYYSPAWHRFVNSDQGVDPNSPNQFAYCIGSPMMAVDPSGMSWIGDFWDWWTGVGNEDFGYWEDLPSTTTYGYNSANVPVACKWVFNTSNDWDDNTGNASHATSYSSGGSGISRQNTDDKNQYKQSTPDRDWLEVTADFAAGWGDMLSLGLTNTVRDWMGTNQYVDQKSNTYVAGRFVGLLHGAAINGAGRATGYEIKVGNNWRFAPWGNRTGNTFGEKPHYHRRGKGDGQGIGRHRPWETKKPDTSYWDKF